MTIKERFEAVKKSKVFNRIVRKYNLNKKQVLDLGCSYGEHMVNFGENSIGITASKEEVDYAISQKIDIRFGNVELIDKINLEKKFNYIWANNIIEHVLSPHSFLVKLKTVSTDKTVLILGVPVVPKILSLLRIKKFKGSLASNHINFFTIETLRLTVERSGWKTKNIRSFVFENNFIDKIFALFSPHIYIVAENDVNYKYPPKKISEWKDDDYYRELLKLMTEKYI